VTTPLPLTPASTSAPAPATPPPLLEARGLHYAYRGRTVLDAISLEVRCGELVGLVGVNGSGKSTLLRLLAGVLPLQGGSVQVQGTDFSLLGRRELAREITLVPQETRIDFDFTVREVVAMGRTPYLGRFSPESEADRAAIGHALEATATSSLADRLVPELSGGERQRVHLARALAQQARCILLDEPTAHLDLAHQHECLQLVQRYTQQGGAVVVALHDLALAARFCTRLVVLSGGRLVTQGPPEEVVTEPNLLRYFSLTARVRKDEETGTLLICPREVAS
jgi:iron complex transport system ATP-binding protein